MPCQSCLTSIRAALIHARPHNQEDQFSVVVHESLYEVERSFGKGCWICKQILRSISQFTTFDSDESDDSTGEIRFTSCPETLSRRRKSRNTVVQLQMSVKDGYYPMEFTAIKGFQSKRLHRLDLELHLSARSIYWESRNISLPMSLTSGSNQTTLICDLWNQWMHTCSKSHENCRALKEELRPFVPDRLVEIYTEDYGHSFTWKLVSRANIGDVQYFTLSHCWGSSTHANLTNSNMSARRKLRTYLELPKTFQDAFLVTFSLGFRFIWIDSLCIIQDDPVDWKMQASMMGKIYKHACCNIAATWAANGDDGCFTKKTPRVFTLDLGPDQSITCEVQRRTLYYDDLMEAPLNRRGWVAQERYLARRQLSFAKSQVYWECQELVASEQYPAGIPESLRNYAAYNQAIPPTVKPSFNLTTEADLRDAWAALVDFYSNCKFSRLSDKMIALAGLAEEMRNKTGDVYLAGLWKRDLRSRLCWAGDFDVRQRIRRSMMPIYIAPTWSWANVNGPVLSDTAYNGFSYRYVWCVEVLDVCVRSEHVSELHSFVGSKLVLRGIAVWARAIQIEDHVGTGSKTKWAVRPTETDDKSQRLFRAVSRVEIHWDENMFAPRTNLERRPSFLEERTSDLLWMFVHLEGTWVEGLLLRKYADTSGEISYVRMGVFSIDDIDLDDVSGIERGISSGEFEEIDLDDAGYAGLVHTVIVV